MTCLVAPQFKCPSTTTITTTPSSSSSESSFRPSHYGHVKTRDYVCFRTHCALSTVTVLADIEKLQIPLREANSDLVSAVSPLTYIGANVPPTKMDFEAAMSKEFLLMDDGAVIAAAAAEAITLARAAVEVAKDAALMTATKSDKSDCFLSEADILQIERVRLSRSELVAGVDYSSTSTIEPVEENIAEKFSTNTEIPSSAQNELQQIHHLKKKTVRSGRQKERRARRARLAEKTAVTVSSVNNGSSGRKKRVVLQGIDYSDPLRYLRSTTSTSRLLTASEELELSEGIQDLLKLEKLRDELEERNGCQPVFAQWAAAAGFDQRTLRKRLNYGILCKDKMIKSNIRLVISIAKNYQGAGMNLQDLVQEGCRGLVKGAEKFDASKGFKFSTYAHWWIKQAVRKSLSDQSRTIRLPPSKCLNRLLEVLTTFGRNTGLQMNPEKKGFIFNKNCIHKGVFKEILKVEEGVLPVRYLGFPLSIQKTTYLDRQRLIEFCSNKLEGWQALRLSFGGRILLVKAVINTLNAYLLQSIQVPKVVLKNIESVGLSLGLNCVDQKNEGGTVLRRHQEIKTALMLKLFWNLTTDSMWTSWMRNRCIKGRSIWYLPLDNNASSSFKVIIKVRSVAVDNINRAIANGNNTSIWFDPWIPERRIIERLGWGSYDVLGGNEQVFILNNGVWRPELLQVITNMGEQIRRIPTHSEWSDDTCPGFLL